MTIFNISVDIEQVPAWRHDLVPVEDALRPPPRLHSGHHQRGPPAARRQAEELQCRPVPAGRRPVRPGHGRVTGGSHSNTLNNVILLNIPFRLWSKITNLAMPG